MKLLPGILDFGAMVGCGGSKARGGAISLGSGGGTWEVGLGLGLEMVVAHSALETIVQVVGESTV